MSKIVRKPCPPVRIWEISPPEADFWMGAEYHHIFSRNMNITTAISTILTCPTSDLLKTICLVTPPPPLIYELRFFDFRIYLPNWGKTRTATCISQANVHQQLSNTITQITELINITCKKRGKIKDLLETAQCLFRVLKILALGL